MSTEQKDTAAEPISVLLDTNQLLNVLVKNRPISDEERRASTKIWRANAAGVIRAGISAISLINVFYLVERAEGRAAAWAAARECLRSLRISRVDYKLLLRAEQLGGPDIEDNSHLLCAKRDGYSALITSDRSFANPIGFNIQDPITFAKTIRLLKSKGK